MNMIKYSLSLSSFTIVLILLNLNNIVSYSEEDFPKQTTKRNNTNFDISTLVFEPGSRPFNLTYADWTTKWWQWAYSIPKNIHPAYDDIGKFCNEGQETCLVFPRYLSTFSCTLL